MTTHFAYISNIMDGDGQPDTGPVSCDMQIYHWDLFGVCTSSVKLNFALCKCVCVCESRSLFLLLLVSRCRCCLLPCTQRCGAVWSGPVDSLQCHWLRGVLRKQQSSRNTAQNNPSQDNKQESQKHFSCCCQINQSFCVIEHSTSLINTEKLTQTILKLTTN